MQTIWRFFFLYCSSFVIVNKIHTFQIHYSCFFSTCDVEVKDSNLNLFLLSLYLFLFPSLPFPPVSPPVLSVPSGGQVVSVREGGNAELVCLVVDGKPRPPILWSRTEKDLLMPSGRPVVETPDGRLRLKNVTRDMMGAYRCQTAPYNGLNIKRREAQVQLNVQCKCGSDHFHPRTRHTTIYNNIL